jgi:GxxExxY protein
MQGVKDNIESLNKITQKIIGLAIEVHTKLGPGFIEKIYQEALAFEFDKNGLRYEKEKIITIEYKEKVLGEQRLDFLVEDSVILETKAIERIGDIHLAQVLSYLKATDKKLSLILNFANTRLEIKRVIN